MDIRTNRQKKSDAARDKACTMYRELRSLYPNASNNLLYEYIAHEMKYTANGIRRIVVNAQQS